MTTVPRRIAVITCGGTIAGRRMDNGTFQPLFGSDELLQNATAPEGVQLVGMDQSKVPSRAMQLADVLRLVQTADQLSETSAVDGVVITQGTDTLEETAYLFELMSNAHIPIVLTGAMLPASRPGSDAAANLSAAIHVAAEATAAGLGPLVVMGNEIHAARWATKVHSTNFAAFASPGFGPIGVVSEGKVRLWGATRPMPLGRPSQIQQRVELLYMACGDDGRLAKAAGEFSDGLVIAGMGGGHVPPRAADVLGELARQIPIVLASRCIAGPVLTSTYSGAGSESDLIAKGLLPVGQLHPVKARLRLLVGLALGLRPEEIFPV